jgi:hypothetical protein
LSLGANFFRDMMSLVNMQRRHLPFRKRSVRLWLGVLVSLCLLMNQWAVAAYVCPTSEAALPCHQHADAKQPGMCHQHCDPMPLSSVQSKAPTVPPAIAPPLPPAPFFVSVLPGGVARTAIDVASTDPPPITRFCRYLN